MAETNGTFVTELLLPSNEYNLQFKITTTSSCSMLTTYTLPFHAPRGFERQNLCFQLSHSNRFLWLRAPVQFIRVWSAKVEGGNEAGGEV